MATPSLVKVKALAESILLKQGFAVPHAESVVLTY